MSDNDRTDNNSVHTADSLDQTVVPSAPDGMFLPVSHKAGSRSPAADADGGLIQSAERRSPLHVITTRHAAGPNTNAAMHHYTTTQDKDNHMT